MELVGAVLLAIWIMLPAYLPNNVAVLAGGGPPIDGGRVWQGRRILGDGKTWRGTLAGIVGGVVGAVVLNAIHGQASGALGVAFPVFSWAIVFAFPVGALVGDMVASFVKRRLDRKRGSAVPVIDQLDFVVMALLFGLIFDFGWMRSVFTPLIVVIVLVLTPILHVGTNGLAYTLGLKDVPW